MKRIGLLVVAAMFLAVACDDDDDTGEPIVPGDAGLQPDADGTTTFRLTLSTQEEVPACAAAGQYASGEASVSVSADGSSITVMALYSGLSGDATAAHVHFGQPGEAGPIVLPLPDPGSPIQATFTAADYPAAPPAGAAADFAGFVEQVRAGDTYLNVHTEACPAGEIRGQIE